MPTKDTSRSDRWHHGSVLAGAWAVLAVHAWSYRPFLADDALISLRYAQRLIEGKGLTWTDGERVEGYSNLLWTLACAGLGSCGVDLIVAARLLGFIGMAAAIAAVVHFGRASSRTEGSVVSPPGPLIRAFPPFIGSFALALCAPIAVWAIGGLEQSMLAGLLAWAVVLLVPAFEGAPIGGWRFHLASVLLALLVLTRPDGVLFVAVIVLGAAAARALTARERKGEPLRAALVLAAGPAAAYLGQLGFRLAYYQEWFPNTAYVKVGFSMERWQEGLDYVASAATVSLPLMLIAALAVVPTLRERRGRGTRLVLVSMILTWGLYLATIGGDIFPAWRHFVPILVLAALLAVGSTEWLAERWPRARRALWPVGLAALSVLFCLQLDDEENLRAKDERWEWDGQAVGHMLKTAFGDRQPLLAVDAAGCLPYFSELPSVDMLGLNDKHIARHRPSGFVEGEFRLFHELGDGRYVLDREPDLIVFGRPSGGDPVFRSGLEMIEDGRLLRDFQPVNFAATEPYEVESTIWVRRDGGAVGIERQNGSVVVPAYFLCAEDDVAVMLSEDDPPAFGPVAIGSGALDGAGRIGRRIERGEFAVLPSLVLGEGRWTITADPAAPQLRIRARLRPPVAGPPATVGDSSTVPPIDRSAGTDSGSTVDSPDARTIDVPPGSDGLVDVRVELVDLPELHLRSLRFAKVSGDGGSRP